MKKNRFGIVYLIINKINGKKYIGITTKKKGFNGRYNAKGDGIERVYNFLNNLKKSDSPFNQHLLRSIEKYGFDQFEVIEEFEEAFSKEELLERERYWIEYYKSNDYNYGYNNTNGGEGLDGGTQSFISKLKRRIANAKRVNSLLYVWHETRSKWENPHLYIWNEDDGLNKKQKELLLRKLRNGKTKFCKICGIEYYHSGKGDYCKDCGDTEFLQQYKLHKREIKNLIIK